MTVQKCKLIKRNTWDPCKKVKILQYDICMFQLCVLRSRITVSTSFKSKPSRERILLMNNIFKTHVCCRGNFSKAFNVWQPFYIVHLAKVYSRNHCTAHAHKAEPNVIQCSENTLGSRTRESQFFYVWLTVLLPVMFRIIAVRSKVTLHLSSHNLWD